MTKKVIEIKDLSYSYPDGNVALRDVNLEVNAGDTLGIVGPNGAGKSTLLLHLNGILKGKGHIKILDSDLSDKNLKLIRSKIGMVFQDPDNQLFMPTVFEDVAFGPMNMGMSKDEVKEAVEKALEKVDMLENIQRISHHLSFGEKKRIAIATVLSMNPEILVLDEPTSNLDPKHRRKLINLLRGLKTTKIIATHDLEMVIDICSRVILIDHGTIIADGDVRQILSNKELLELHSLEVPVSILYPAFDRNFNIYLKSSS
jgi:cobalt/nickel transport system ATP-binding protein